MTLHKIEVWRCDAACEEQAPAGADGWLGSVYVHGCPAHAELVGAHLPRLSYDTRGRGSRAVTSVSAACLCGWIPATRWTHGSVQALIDEHLAHVREVAGSVTSPNQEEIPSHG